MRICESGLRRSEPDTGHVAVEAHGGSGGSILRRARLMTSLLQQEDSTAKNSARTCAMGHVLPRCSARHVPSPGREACGLEDVSECLHEVKAST